MGLPFAYKAWSVLRSILSLLHPLLQITFMAPSCSTACPTSISNAVEVADKFKAVESLQSNPLYSAAIWLAALDEVALLAVCLPV